MPHSDNRLHVRCADARNFRQTLSNTNAMESANSVAASVIKHVKHWNGGEQRRNLMRRTNINAVLNMVQQYLDGQISRLDMELDFLYEVEKRYSKMCSENREYAELINDRLLDDGVLIGDDLSDEDFHKLIKQQYEGILDIADGGFV